MPQQASIACSKVWGGNRAANAALVLPGLQGWVVSQPYHEAESGGDVHYISSCGTGRITRMILADVSGHGEPASAVSGFLRDVMQRYLNHIEPGKLAAEMNQRLSAHEQRGGRFATAVILTFFSPTGRMTLCNAGHPAPLIYRRSRGEWAALDDPRAEPDVVNFPLGVVEEAGYTGREFVLDPGDHVLAYSDCLIEARDDDGRLIGVGGLTDVLNEIGDPGTMPNPGELTDRIIRRIEGLGYQRDDDLTAVVLHCTERTEGATLPERLAGIWRSVRLAFTGARTPLPELSVRNLGGALVPALSRWRPRRRR